MTPTDTHRLRRLYRWLFRGYAKHRPNDGYSKLSPRRLKITVKRKNDHRTVILAKPGPVYLPNHVWEGARSYREVKERYIAYILSLEIVDPWFTAWTNDLESLLS